MRRTHLRGHRNILKRLLVHAGGFNLGLIMRQLVGAGTPRGLQGRLGALTALLTALARLQDRRWAILPDATTLSLPTPSDTPDDLAVAGWPESVSYTTGC